MQYRGSSELYQNLETFFFQCETAGKIIQDFSHTTGRVRVWGSNSKFGQILGKTSYYREEKWSGEYET